MPFGGSPQRWASLLVFAFVLQFLTAQVEVGYGLANRFFAMVLVGWLLAISIKLRASVGE